MERDAMNRRDFHQWTMAALGGIVAGSAVGCNPPADDAATGSGSVSGTPANPADEDNLLLQEPHVCRGLNMCKGQGAGGENDCAGQGACASVAQHDCSGQNECAGQGGCGSNPGQNDCKGQGGCHVPLMDHAWDTARKNFEAAMQQAGREVGAAPAAAG